MRFEQKQWEELSARALRDTKQAISSVEQQVHRLLKGLHPPEEPSEFISWKCRICADTMDALSDIEDIKAHVRWHMAARPRPNKRPCEGCGIPFLFESDLLCHKATVCTGTVYTGNEDIGSECEKLVAEAGSEFSTAMEEQRSQFAADLDVWEEYQIYDFLVRTEEHLRSQGKKSGEARDTLRGGGFVRVKPVKDPFAEFVQGSSLARHSCLTYTRYTETSDRRQAFEAAISRLQLSDEAVLNEEEME